MHEDRRKPGMKTTTVRFVRQSEDVVGSGCRHGLDAPGPRVQISVAGFDPTASSTALDWSHDLHEIVTIAGDVRQYTLECGADVRVTGSRVLFTLPAAAVGAAVMPDHARVLATLPVAGAEQPAIAVATDWRAALHSH